MPSAIKIPKKIRPKKRVIIKGIPLNIEKIALSVKFNPRIVAKQKEITKKTGYTLNDFMTAYSRPKTVGSEGFLTWSVMPKADAGNERVILVGGVAVPSHKRRKGIRVALQRELFKQIYSRFGELIKKDKNDCIQTQISAKDNVSLKTLQKRLGYAIFKQFPEQGVIVLRKRLDTIEMEKLLPKKKGFFSRLINKK